MTISTSLVRRQRPRRGATLLAAAVTALAQASCSTTKEQGGADGFDSGIPTLETCPSYQPVDLRPAFIMAPWPSLPHFPLEFSGQIQQMDGTGSSACETPHWLAFHDDDLATQIDMCASTPGLAWSVGVGDEITASLDWHPHDTTLADITLYVTSHGATVLFEARSIEAPIAFPPSIGVTGLDATCQVPPGQPPTEFNDCRVLRHSVDVTIDGQTATITPGDTVVVAGEQVLIGQYDTYFQDKACGPEPEGKEAIGISVFPNSAPDGG